MKYLGGEISYMDVYHNDDRSSLLRPLGKLPCKLEAGQARLRSGDAFLLCSDGLWEYVYQEEMLSDLLKAETPKQWAEGLSLEGLTGEMEKIPFDERVTRLYTSINQGLDYFEGLPRQRNELRCMVVFSAGVQYAPTGGVPYEELLERVGASDDTPFGGPGRRPEPPWRRTERRPP